MCLYARLCLTVFRSFGVPICLALASTLSNNDSMEELGVIVGDGSGIGEVGGVGFFIIV